MIDPFLTHARRPFWQASASQIKTFRRCRSAWFFEKVLGFETPTSPSMLLGTEVHAILETYLVDGTPVPDTPAGKIARAALPALPPAGTYPREYVERRFASDWTTFDGEVIKVRGLIDLVTADGVIDFKTSSNPKKYGKTPEELKADPQAEIYAIEVSSAMSPPIAFSHLYLDTKDPKTTTSKCEFSAADLRGATESIRGDLTKMSRTAALPAPDVPFDLTACGDYGGCPHRHRCASLGRPTAGALSNLFTTTGGPMTTNDPLANMLAGRTPAPPRPESHVDLAKRNLRGYLVARILEADPEQDRGELESMDPLSLENVLAALNGVDPPNATAINPPDGTPPTVPVDLAATTSAKTSTRGLRLEGVLDDEGAAVLLSVASKPQLIEFARLNAIDAPPPPTGRTKAGVREWRKAVNAFLTGADPASIPVPAKDATTIPIVPPISLPPSAPASVPLPNAPSVETVPAAIPLPPILKTDATEGVDPSRPSIEDVDLGDRRLEDAAALSSTSDDVRYNLENRGDFGRFRLFVNCIPRAGMPSFQPGERYLVPRVWHAEALTGPISAEVATAAGVPYFGLIAFNEGPKRVVAVLLDRLRSGALSLDGVDLVVDRRSPCGDLVIDALSPRAVEVVRAFL